MSDHESCCSFAEVSLNSAEALKNSLPISENLSSLPLPSEQEKIFEEIKNLLDEF